MTMTSDKEVHSVLRHKEDPMILEVMVTEVKAKEHMGMDMENQQRKYCNQWQRRLMTNTFRHLLNSFINMTFILRGSFKLGN